MIREVVADGRMPPWHADPKFGHFRNDRRLPEADRKALLAWVDQGCPEGDPRELPGPRTFVEGWRIGTPDRVVRMNKEVRVPANYMFGLTAMPYQYVLAGEPFAEDAWV